MPRRKKGIPYSKREGQLEAIKYFPPYWHGYIKQSSMSNRVYIIPTRGGAATQVYKDPTAQKAKKKMRTNYLRQKGFEPDQ